MKTMSVILREQASKESIIELVESFGGCWRTNPSVPEKDEGVIQKGDAFVLLDYSHVKECESDYEPEELEFLRKQLGVEPNIEVVFAIRRNDASEQLAREIAAKIIEKWGGYLDLSDERLNNLGE